MTALTVDGVDLSRFQTYEVNYPLAKSMGVKFIYHKITEGVTITHAVSYATRRAEAKKAKIPFGAYHFARPSKDGGDAVAEAQWFLKHAQFEPGDLVPMLDLEDTGNMSRAQLTLWVKTWMLEVEKVTRVKPIIYTNFDLDSTFGAYLWQARYNNENELPRQAQPWKQIDIFQFSNGFFGNPKRIDAFPGATDLNHILSKMTVANITSKVGGYNPDQDHMTGAFRITTQNVQALPLMPQNEVVHDINLTASQSGVIGWQELQPERYDKALHALERSGKWETYWGQNGVDEKPSQEDQGENEWYSTPISWRKRHWSFIRGGKWLLHKGKRGVTGNRWVTWVMLKHKKTGAVTLFTNLHFVAGAFNNKFKGALKREVHQMWQAGWVKLIDWLTKMIEKYPNAAIAVLGDFNATRSQIEATVGNLRVGNRKIYLLFSSSIDHILFINGRKYKWDVQSRETLPGRHSDHSGRRAYARLNWAA